MNEARIPSRPHENALSRLNHAMGPVLAGMIIDLVDLITAGPFGLVLGIPVGATAGYWLGQSMRLEKNACLFCAIAAAIYCTIPFTEVLPLGTLVGALVRFEDAGHPRSSSPSPTAGEEPADEVHDEAV